MWILDRNNISDFFARVKKNVKLQLWFPSKFMDCWAMYLMDKDKKTMMVLDPTEIDVMDEMKIKHEARAKKFQRRFRSLFNNFFGNGLVDTDGWTFLYPLVAQHEPCSRFPPTTLS